MVSLHRLAILNPLTIGQGQVDKPPEAIPDVLGCFGIVVVHDVLSHVGDELLTNSSQTVE